MKYPVKATFYTISETQNAYNEVVKTPVVSFSTGVRPTTVSFKDQIAGGQSVSGKQFYLYTRKNPNTKSVSVGDYVKLSELASETFEVIGVDPMYANRSELLMFIDLVEGVTV